MYFVHVVTYTSSGIHRPNTGESASTGSSAIIRCLVFAFSTRFLAASLHLVQKLRELAPELVWQFKQYLFLRLHLSSNKTILCVLRPEACAVIPKDICLYRAGPSRSKAGVEQRWREKLLTQNSHRR